ncbi:hypothetical protein [Saccharothrix syringae]|uniref:Uncharacterized protein n=1 Tax=Saccharothrix syringae TaxID=103733 RepID=A0A5Q0H2X9_SACSY|nr:hypothetical protein [Saccharothrix syringae]QFZ20597.1 hypothetical protein EKG83_27150 [Saccharothrix syringae]
MTEPIPYEEITEQSYAETAAASFTVTEVSSAILLLRGACPRCGAALEVPLVGGVFNGMRGVSPEAADTDGHVEPMACTCEHDHPNRPEGMTGCGAYWNLRIGVAAE